MNERDHLAHSFAHPRDEFFVEFELHPTLHPRASLFIELFSGPLLRSG